MDTTSVYAPITKMAPQDDGSLLVHGKATGSDLDLDQQRCDPGWLSRAVPEWFKIGNIREMHDGHRAVGKATEHEHRDDDHYITAKIVDPVAIAKAKAGVYTGFSIGVKSPRISKSVDAPNGVITDGRIVEISIVDAPCLPTATLTLVKAATPGMEINSADFDEDRGLVKCEELVETLEAVDKAVTVEEATDAGLTAPLADRLPPGQVEKLAAAAEPVGESGGVPTAVISSRSVADAPQTTPAMAADFVAEKAADTEAVDVPAEQAEAPSFDVDAAKALVADALAKAEGDDMVTFAPVTDEDLATAVISIISRLIQSEAAGMVANPGEDDDIRCLLSAAASMRWYQRRERQEGDVGGVSDAAPYEYAELAATPDAEQADTKIVVKNDDVSTEMQAAVDAAFAKAVKPQVNDAWRSAPPATAEAVAKADTSEPITKTTDADTVKAAVVEDEENPADALVKALSAALEKADSPLRASFEAIVKASTDAIQETTETTAKSVTELTERLVKVESMAVPGGPVLRRTEVERAQSRRNDLALEVRRFKALAANATDVDLRQGYATWAAQLETELKSL